MKKYQEVLNFSWNRWTLDWVDGSLCKMKFFVEVTCGNGKLKIENVDSGYGIWDLG